jgi:hypothetical protein
MSDVGTYNFTIQQGATWTRTLTWKIDGVAVNLTGYTARMQLREAGTLVIELTTANGRIALGGAAGTITLTITAADTTALNFKTALYDLELVSGGGVVTRLLEGRVFLSREVTV